MPPQVYEPGVGLVTIVRIFGYELEAKAKLVFSIPYFSRPNLVAEHHARPSLLA